jgi:hypothetical protein
VVEDAVMGWMTRLWGRYKAQRRAALKGEASPEWSTIDSYVELSRLTSSADFQSHDEFVEGPLERYLQLIEASPGRAGARIMEFASGSIRAFLEHETRSEHAAAALATIEAKVRGRFASGSENDQYMIEVFEGRATHNYRAARESDKDEDV